MKDFEERQRELFRAHLRTNIAAFSQTSAGTMTILSTRTLVGRLDASNVSRSLALARQPAWAAISANLHTQLQTLVRETGAHLGTQHAVLLPHGLRSAIDQPILGMTLPQWFAAAEVQEGLRVLKAMRSGYALSKKPLDAFTDAAPYSLSNSSIGAITVTAATSVMNRVALAIFSLAGIKSYRLETSGDIRDPRRYDKLYSVNEEPEAPMFIGDRSYPVPA